MAKQWRGYLHRKLKERLLEKAKAFKKADDEMDWSHPEGVFDKDNPEWQAYMKRMSNWQFLYSDFSSSLTEMGIGTLIRILERELKK